jgi:hypothetical protein
MVFEPTNMRTQSADIGEHGLTETNIKHEKWRFKPSTKAILLSANIWVWIFLPTISEYGLKFD